MVMSYCISIFCNKYYNSSETFIKEIVKGHIVFSSLIIIYRAIIYVSLVPVETEAEEAKTRHFPECLPFLAPSEPAVTKVKKVPFG